MGSHTIKHGERVESSYARLNGGASSLRFDERCVYLYQLASQVEA